MKKFLMNIHAILTGVILMMLIGFKDNSFTVGNENLLVYFLGVLVLIIILFSIFELVYRKQKELNRVKIFLLVIIYALFVRIFIDYSSNELEVIFSIIFIAIFAYLASYHNETVLKLSKPRQTVIIFLFLLAIEISTLVISYTGLSNDM